MKDAARISVSTALIVVFWALVIVYVLNASLGNTREHQTALSLPYEAKLWQPIRLIAPQGWGFFTKSPRDDEFNIYRLDNSLPKQVFRGPSARARNAFGFNRIPRAQGAEYGLLINLLPARNWTTCQGALSTCLAGLKLHSISNPSTHPLLCGELLFVQQKTVPWAWTSFTNVEMPKLLIHVDIQCRGDRDA